MTIAGAVAGGALKYLGDLFAYFKGRTYLGSSYEKNKTFQRRRNLSYCATTI
jgi:hypothetical protein